MNPKTKKVIEASLIVISVGSIFFGAYYFGQKGAQKKNNAIKEAETKEEAEVSQINSLNQEIGEPQEVVDLESETIKKGWIKWQEPKDLGDLGLTSKEVYSGCQYGKCGQEYIGSEGVRYAKSGEVVKGRYQGYEFIVISSGASEGPSVNPNFYRILKKGEEIIFLSSPAYGIEDYDVEFIKSVFSRGAAKKIFNEKITVEELAYPEELYGPTDRQRFTKDPYARAFFTDAKLKTAFVNQKYGQVWVTDETKAINKNPTPFDLNSYTGYEGEKSYYDIFGRYGFYMRAPDGTAVAYKMKLDIFDVQERIGKLKAVWNDGQKNQKNYEENPSGCGGGDYVYDETLEVNPENDLELIGKTEQGDDLWGYKNSQSPGFQKLYNEIYWTEKAKDRLSPEEFLKIRPKVFWRDYLGRVLAFYRADIISPAECGKPVIYLYPENPMNVSVKVAPGNGLSYTLPKYENGWKVLADNQSRLTNLSDGKQYPYLFWEGAGSVYYERPQQGFVTRSENLDEFFDEKLAKLGLIEKEIADFKEFWIPEMKKTQKPFFFVTFLSKGYIDALAPLSIEPQPDTVIRVMMDYQGLDQYQTVSEISLKTPERKGFTAVEWGGMLKK